MNDEDYKKRAKKEAWEDLPEWMYQLIKEWNNLKCKKQKFPITLDSEE